jgi:hypothetical protein
MTPGSFHSYRLIIIISPLHPFLIVSRLLGIWLKDMLFRLCSRIAYAYAQLSLCLGYVGDRSG